MVLRTLVTGANGRVGRVLRTRLPDLRLTFATRTVLDATDIAALRSAFAGHEQIIHLATPIKGNAGTIDAFAQSVEMVRRVLDAARESGVRRVVIPSSISALSQDQLRGSAPVTIETSRASDTEYGRTRIVVEGLCREAASDGFEVICIRLGMVRHPDAPSFNPIWRPHWLSHEDCASLFRTCLESPLVPGRFSLFYAVSALPERILDSTNPFGWVPRSKSVGLKRGLIATSTASTLESGAAFASGHVSRK